MSEASPGWSIRPARPEEWAEASRLLLGPDLTAPQMHAGVAAVQRHLQLGTLDPAAFFLALDGSRIVGAILGQCLPGAQALLFDVPQALPGYPAATRIEDQLLTMLLAWLQRRGVKLVQCLLPRTETSRATSLLRGNFRFVTELRYLLHFLDTLPSCKETGLEFVRYAPALRDRLAAAITATYLETMDCPELNDLLSITEVIEGYERKAVETAPAWWLLRRESRDIGVLLLQLGGSEATGEVAYMGLIPTARFQGFGRMVMRFAMLQAKEAGLRTLQLSVDVRNAPALRLYDRLGFIPWEEKVLFMATLAE